MMGLIGELLTLLVCWKLNLHLAVHLVRGIHHPIDLSLIRVRQDAR